MQNADLWFVDVIHQLSVINCKFLLIVTCLVSRRFIALVKFAMNRTIIDNFNAPAGVAADSKGYIYVACYTDNTILRINPKVLLNQHQLKQQLQIFDYYNQCYFFEKRTLVNQP